MLEQIMPRPRAAMATQRQKIKDEQYILKMTTVMEIKGQKLVAFDL
jgi:hypothetical protein